MFKQVDCSVILLMEDYQLSQYIPRYGDRLSVVSYCRQMRMRQEPVADNSSVFVRLWERLANTRKPDKSLPVLGHKRSTRALEVGWADFNFREKRYKQVRQRSGGGTRHVVMDSHSLMSDVIDKAKELFFPQGRSTRGRLEDFTFELMDFGQEPVSNLSQTVSEVYDLTRLKLLRFYIFTRRRSHAEDAEGPDADETTG